MGFYIQLYLHVIQSNAISDFLYICTWPSLPILKNHLNGRDSTSAAHLKRLFKIPTYEQKKPPHLNSVDAIEWPSVILKLEHH